MSSGLDARQNHLLAGLPSADYQRLAPHLEQVALNRGDVVYESGQVSRYAYFPTDCIISLLYVMTDGASGEIALVGLEGVVGIQLLIGGQSTSTRGMVQSAGSAYRVKGDVIMHAFQLGGALQQCLLRYTLALISQVAQTAVCNRHHTVEQQLCRWLLLSLDRLPSNKLAMTQELIASMLGVRREGITQAARKLQARGIVEYRRGNMTVLDRAGLEKASCECYAAVKREYARLLPRAKRT